MELPEILWANPFNCPFKLIRYGVIHGTGEQELQPLDKHVDEDEEDMTLFDVKDAKRPKWSTQKLFE